MSLKTAGFLAALLFAGSPAGVSAGAESCADCHGKDGASTESDVPSIGGMSEQYLVEAMAAYRDSKRPCAKSAYRAGDRGNAATTAGTRTRCPGP